MIPMSFEPYSVHMSSTVDDTHQHFLEFLLIGLFIGCSVTVGPAEPKNKPSAIGDYPSSTFKRAKPDHTSLRTLTAYGGSPSHGHYQPTYGQSQNTDMMHTFFQQYGTPSSGASKGSYSTAQQAYWSSAHDEAAAAAIWQQQQQQHYR
jgi:hypothetical protein